MIIKIEAAFPIEWGKEYYTVEKTVKEKRAPCMCCDNTGKVIIKGVKYECPRCRGNWRNKEVVGETIVYSVAKWALESAGEDKSALDITPVEFLRFRQTNSKDSRWANKLELRGGELNTMRKIDYSKIIQIYDDYHTAMAEVKRLNAAEREKDKQ